MYFGFCHTGAKFQIPWQRIIATFHCIKGKIENRRRPEELKVRDLRADVRSPVSFALDKSQEKTHYSDTVAQG
jgi:hypothetical protein